MFKSGDRVRVKTPGTYLGVTYGPNSEGTVTIYFSEHKECAVVFDCPVIYEGRERKTGLNWLIPSEHIELVPSKKKRRKKQPIPEGWE